MSQNKSTRKRAVFPLRSRKELTNEQYAKMPGVAGYVEIGRGSLVRTSALLACAHDREKIPPMVSKPQMI